MESKRPKFPNILNLEMLLRGRDLTTYQRGLALDEFEALKSQLEELKEISELLNPEETAGNQLVSMYKLLQKEREKVKIDTSHFDSIKWLLTKGMEITKSDFKYDVFADYYRKIEEQTQKK